MTTSLFRKMVAVGGAALVAALPFSYVAYRLLQGMGGAVAPATITAAAAVRADIATDGPTYGVGEVTCWDFDVRYRYQVDGRDYTGSKIRLNRDSYCSAASVAQMRQRFALGAAVPVTYLPRDPGDAAVEWRFTHSFIKKMLIFSWLSYWLVWLGLSFRLKLFSSDVFQRAPDLATLGVLGALLGSFWLIIAY